VQQSGVMAFRRAKTIGARNFQGRLAAIWPCLGTGICALVLLEVDRGQQAASMTTYSFMFVGAFSFGWLIGVLAEAHFAEITRRG